MEGCSADEDGASVRLAAFAVDADDAVAACVPAAAPSPPPKKRRRESDATLCEGNEGAATPQKARFKIGKKTESQMAAEAAEAADKAAAEKAAAEKAAGKAKKHKKIACAGALRGG